MKYAKDFIKDFVDTELTGLTGQDMLNDLLEISKNLNIVYYEYECNQYNVIFDRRKSSVIIYDAVSEEWGVSQEYTRLVISQSEFIDILLSSIEKQ